MVLSRHFTHPRRLCLQAAGKHLQQPLRAGWDLPRKRLIGCALVCGATIAVSLAAAGLVPWSRNTNETAYFDGKEIEYRPASAHRGEKPFRIGRLELGPKVASQQKNDKRPNLYVVVPGRGSEDREALAGTSTRSAQTAPDYNLVVSAVPDDEPAEFDVFWAVILDPDLKEDIRAETQLVLAAQEAFTPDEHFQFSQIPSQVFLRNVLHIESLDQLADSRRPDGTFPKIAIIPARFAVRAKVSGAPDQP